MTSINRVGMIAFGLMVIAATLQAADRWVITRATTSGNCTVQLETSRPFLGEVIGTYDTRDAAQKALAAFKKSGRCE